MWYHRCLLTLCALTGVFFLAGALRGPSWLAHQDEPILAAHVQNALDGPAEARATGLFLQARKALQDPHRPWLQTRVWMRFHVPEAQFRGEGIFLRAPGGRYRLEVRTRPREQESGDSAGCLLQLCDGQTHWQALGSETGKSGDERPYREVKRLNLQQLPGGVTPKSILRGPLALLESLEHSHVWVHSEQHAQDEILTGVWSSVWRPLLVPRGQPWPENLPRLYRISLRGNERWPGRIETWGPLVANGSDRLLAEIEFRDPVFDRPLSAQECARLFHFDPGQTPVEDETPRFRAP